MRTPSSWYVAVATECTVTTEQYLLRKELQISVIRWWRRRRQESSA